MLSTVEKVLALKRIALFEHIPGEELARIARIAEEVNFMPGDTFIYEGDLGDSLYIIIEGEVEIHRKGVRITNLSQYQTVGEMAILDSEPRSASVTVISEIKALKIEREDFYDILAERNEIAQGIIRILTQRLRNEMNRHEQPAG